MATYFYHEYSKTNKPVCDLVYERFLEANTAVGELYPEYDSARGDIVKSLILYGLDKSFYPSVNVSWQLWHNLIHSNRYKSIAKKI